jgi:hypothetical protein
MKGCVSHPGRGSDSNRKEGSVGITSLIVDRLEFLATELGESRAALRTAELKAEELQRQLDSANAKNAEAHLAPPSDESDQYIALVRRCCALAGSSNERTARSAVAALHEARRPWYAQSDHACHKIRLIKAIREVAGISLGEAKTLVEDALVACGFQRSFY